MHGRLVLVGLSAAAFLFALGCEPSESSIGGGNTGAGGAATDGGKGGGGAPVPGCPDNDGDGFGACAGDCNDTNPAINPMASEVANQLDDNCDGKVDNHIVGADFDHDGYLYGVNNQPDCNDDEPLVGPGAVEDPSNQVDDNCDGKVDEPTAQCDSTLSGTAAADMAKAIGLCSAPLSTTVTGDALSRKIRAKFGDFWSPQAGGRMIMLSSGKAVDGIEAPTYNPQGLGYDFGTTTTHPLYSKPRCAAPVIAPPAKDLSELKISIKVPQNATSLSYQFAFFSAEYPEYICTKYNDRFIALLTSQALDVTKFPSADQCMTGVGTPTCNISYDDKGQPVTINNGFFAVCDSYNGLNNDDKPVSNTCTKPASQLAHTGYDLSDPSVAGHVGGGTGWLTTKAPVKPGETITLRFIVLDEGDGFYDSAVLIDNFKWSFDSVAAPTTEPTIN